MRRIIIPLVVCLLLCLLLLPERGPVALSIPAGDSGTPYCDDGQPLPETVSFDQVAAKDPVAALELSLKRQHREVRGYAGILKKHERIKGKEHPPEVIAFWFREQPYSVLMKWQQGARNAKASMYIDGQNNNKVAVVTNTRIPVSWDLDANGRMAQESGRYSIKEFSIRQATERVLAAWREAQEEGHLVVDYKGVVEVSELNGRKCHVLTRRCNPPAEEGAVTIEIMFDAETWLQTGSTLTDGEGKIIGKYYFCDLQVNPEFAANQFDRAQLKK